MNKIHGFVRSNWVWLVLLTLLARSTATAAQVEEKFEVLTTRAGTYKNVTVTTHAKNYVFIMHSAGLANIRIEDLPLEIQQQLGYAPNASKKTETESSNLSTSSKATVVKAQLLQQMKNLPALWQKYVGGKLPKISPVLALSLLGMTMLFYLFFCYCNMLICQKTGNAPGILVWLPVLQLFPLLRAAGMSGWWFLACFVPVLNIVALIVWSVKIVQAREKSLLLALFLLLPVTNFFAILYLAFASATRTETKPKEEEGGERQLMVLQTA